MMGGSCDLRKEIQRKGERSNEWFVKFERGNSV